MSSRKLRLGRAFLKSSEKEQKRTFIGYVKGIKPKPNQGRSK
jgi:hypothetical protein